jgi:hypothetical protein
MANMLGLLPHLSQQEIEMITAVGFDHGTLALFRRDRLDIVIDALLEAERRGLFETTGVARDLACKLMGLQDGLTPLILHQRERARGPRPRRKGSADLGERQMKKTKRRITAAKKTKPRAKATRGFAIHTGKPTGREVQAMHRLQVLTERYIAEGLTPADAQTRASEELRASPRKD